MTQKFEKWTEVYVQLLKAEQEHTLEPKELEKLALSAYLTGRDAESFQVLERAHQGYLDRGKTEKAVRCAFWLGLTLMNAGEKARGGGWFARGERLLNDVQIQDCAEKGLLLIPKALSELSAGHGAKAQIIFERVASEHVWRSGLEAKRVNFLMRQGIFLKGIPAVRSRKVTPYHQKSELCSPKIGLQTCSQPGNNFETLI